MVLEQIESIMRNALLESHYSEKRGLCLMKCSNHTSFERMIHKKNEHETPPTYGPFGSRDPFRFHLVHIGKSIKQPFWRAGGTQAVKSEMKSEWVLNDHR